MKGGRDEEEGKKEKRSLFASRWRASGGFYTPRWAPSRHAMAMETPIPLEIGGYVCPNEPPSTGSRGTSIRGQLGIPPFCCQADEYQLMARNDGVSLNAGLAHQRWLTREREPHWCMCKVTLRFPTWTEYGMGPTSKPRNCEPARKRWHCCRRFVKHRTKGEFSIG